MSYIMKMKSFHPETLSNAEYTYEIDTIIPHIFTEFNKDENIVLIYAGPVSGPLGKSIFTIQEEPLQNYIRPLINNDTKLFFDNIMEGNFDIMLELVYIVIKDLPIKESQVYLFTAALDAEHHLSNYCKKYNKIPFNVYVANSWESHIRNCNLPEPIFNIKKKEKIFLSFNRVTRHHRIALIGLLYDHDLIEKSFYSFFNNGSHGHYLDIGRNTLNSLFMYLPRRVVQTIVDQYDKHEKDFPLKLNINVDENKTHINGDDFRFYNESYFSVVTETFFFEKTYNNIINENTIFFSEKIFKPIIMKHPFIIVSRPHSLKYLKTLGYKTYSPYIDETYDTIENNTERLLAIVAEIKRLSYFTDEEWITWLGNIKEIAEYNYRIIKSKKIQDDAYARIRANE